MMAPGKIQLMDFVIQNYTNVVMKGAKGLHRNAKPEVLYLLISGGLVNTNCPLQSWKEWTLVQLRLGQYRSEVKRYLEYTIHHILYSQQCELY